MAKIHKKKPSKKINIDQLKKKLISEYIKIKKSKDNIDNIVARGEFVKLTDFTKNDMDVTFGSYTDFKFAGEKAFFDSLSPNKRALLSERKKKFDKDATKEELIDDLRLVQELDPLKHITRNFYRENGKYSDSTWNRYFGTFQEFKRQAGLELSRGQHKLERDIAKHAYLDKIRDFYTQEVMPYHNKFDVTDNDDSKYRTILVGSDFHDIDCDRFMLSTFIDTARRTKPNIIILNGDVFDCYESSRFSQDVRQLKIVERFDFVKDNIFKPLRDACPDAQIDLILGNHEWRILNILAEKTPNLRVILSDVMGLSLSDVFGLDEFEINLVCKLDLAAFAKTDVKNELKQNYRVYYDCFVAGHFKDLSYGMSGTSGHCHRPSTETFTNLIMGKCTWVETGCMCVTDAEYVANRDKWTNSFSIVHIDRIDQQVNQEHIIVSGDSVVIHGIRYERNEKTSKHDKYNKPDIKLSKGIKKA